MASLIRPVPFEFGGKNMKFKTGKDRQQIGRFLNLTCDLITGIVRKILLEKRFKVKEKGEGLNLICEVHKDKSSHRAEFYFHNLFLEITTKDREAEALEFDEKVIDFGYFLSKTLRIVESKVRPLLLVMSEKNVGKGIEKMMELAPQYERLRAIWRDKGK